MIADAKTEFKNLVALQGIDESVGKVDLILDDHQYLQLRDINKHQDEHHK